MNLSEISSNQKPTSKYDVVYRNKRGVLISRGYGDFRTAMDLMDHISSDFRTEVKVYDSEGQLIAKRGKRDD